MHHIIWLKHETAFAVGRDTVLKADRICLGYDRSLLHSIGIYHAARDIDTCTRRSLKQTAGTEYEVLESGVLNIGILAWIGNLTVNCEISTFKDFLNTRNLHHIVLAERDVGSASCQNVVDIERYHLKGEIRSLTIEKSAVLIGILGKPVGLAEKVGQCNDILAKGEYTRAHHGAIDLNTVGVTVEHRADCHYIAVFEFI